MDMDTPPLPATPPPEQTLKAKHDEKCFLEKTINHTWSLTGWQDFY